MVNNVSPFIPELWGPEIQETIKQFAVFPAIANFKEEATLTVGDTVHVPYINRLTVQDYTRGTNASEQDLTPTDETLVVDQEKAILIYVDRHDSIQSLYDIADKYTREAAYQLANEMDKKFLLEILNSTNQFDAGDVGGTAGDPLDLTSSSYDMGQIVSTLRAKMLAKSIEPNGAWDLVVTPEFSSYIERTYTANGFNMSDRVLVDGYIKNGYMGNFPSFGFNVYASTNLPHLTVSTATGNVVADDTYTIEGVTFTFKAAPAAAGEVDLGADAETSLANLAAAINGGAGAGSAYIELASADRDTLINKKVSATSTATTLTATTSGHSIITESLTNVTNGDTVAYNLAEKTQVIDMVVQEYPYIKQDTKPERNGEFYLVTDLYGTKLFDYGVKRTFKVLSIATF